MSKHTWYLAAAVLALAVIVTLSTMATSPAAGRLHTSSTGAFNGAPVASSWHQVQEGESLRSISQDYYGSGRHWRTLQIANDVDHFVPPGTMLLIPGMREELDALGSEAPLEHSQTAVDEGLLSHAAGDP